MKLTKEKIDEILSEIKKEHPEDCDCDDCKDCDSDPKKKAKSAGDDLDHDKETEKDSDNVSESLVDLIGDNKFVAFKDSFEKKFFEKFDKHEKIEKYTKMLTQINDFKNSLAELNKKYGN